MSDEIMTFALTDQIQAETTFYSSDECARYAKGIYNRVTLLNRLYPFLDKNHAENVAKYNSSQFDDCLSGHPNDEN